MTIWVISDGAAGNENQALAVAGALGVDAPAIWRVRARRPWNWLAPQWSPVLGADTWVPPLPLTGLPDLAIGAGRIGAAALLSLKRLSHGRTRTLQILDPRINPARFDALLVPRHDQRAGPNVVVIDGSVHAIDDDWLQRMRAAAPPAAPPRSVALIGGPRAGVPISFASLQRLGATLMRWQRLQGGSIQIIGSRRTPAVWREQLKAVIGTAGNCWFDASDGVNPYRSALAWGDRFIVSADSINMLSEALGTGMPVYALCDGMPSGKIGRFHRSMIDSSRLRPLSDAPQTWSYAPLRELARVLPELTRLLRW